MTASVGRSVPVSVTMYDAQGWKSVSHIELCLNKPSGGGGGICAGDTVVAWDSSSRSADGLDITDPGDLISEASVAVTGSGSNVV